jgi:hypothetical protein
MAPVHTETTFTGDANQGVQIAHNYDAVSASFVLPPSESHLLASPSHKAFANASSPQKDKKQRQIPPQLSPSVAIPTPLIVEAFSIRSTRSVPCQRAWVS